MYFTPCENPVPGSRNGDRTCALPQPGWPEHSPTHTRQALASGPWSTAGPEMLQKTRPLPTGPGQASVMVPLASSSSMVVLVLSEDSWGDRGDGGQDEPRAGGIPPTVKPAWVPKLLLRTFRRHPSHPSRKYPQGAGTGEKVLDVCVATTSPTEGPQLHLPSETRRYSAGYERAGLLKSRDGKTQDLTDF